MQIFGFHFGKVNFKIDREENKDGMAISLTGVESMDGGKMILKFINNEYML